VAFDRGQLLAHRLDQGVELLPPRGNARLLRLLEVLIEQREALRVETDLQGGLPAVLYDLESEVWVGRGVLW
jgi:hypothetical protein